MTEQDLEYVRQMYAASDDPWRIADGFYERRKRQVLLACLPQERYASAFEPACAAGELSVLLAERCDRLLAADVAPRAVELTAARLAGRPGARAERLAVPQDWPAERFDLVVLSEFGYYLPRASWQRLVERAAAALVGDWTVIACHWRSPFAERLIETDQLHEDLVAGLPGRHAVRLLDEDFRLDVLTGRAGTVAERDGRG
ncbi:MAG TPA: SAM-dependent methyltransferase [Jatrophihabitans sp.]|nr:SAM-dependent methyltransferase [Jatrophihabitans sp.]